MKLTKILKNNSKITQSDISSIVINYSQPTLNKLLTVIEKATGIKSKLIFLPTRKREIAECRQLFCFFARSHTEFTTTYIGKFINRDHATVIYSVQNIKNLMHVDKRIRELVQQIDRKL